MQIEEVTKFVGGGQSFASRKDAEDWLAAYDLEKRLRGALTNYPRVGVSVDQIEGVAGFLATMLRNNYAMVPRP